MGIYLSGKDVKSSGVGFTSSAYGIWSSALQRMLSALPRSLSALHDEPSAMGVRCSALLCTPSAVPFFLSAVLWGLPPCVKAVRRRAHRGSEKYTPLVAECVSSFKVVAG